MPFKVPLNATWYRAQCTTYPMGLAGSPASDPEDQQTLLGSLGWAVHRSWPPPKGNPCLCSPGTTWAQPSWPAWGPQGIDKMQAQAREEVYMPDINANIVADICQCTICTKHKASPPAQPMLPRDISDGLWQEISADYLNHKGKEYLLIFNLFSK